LYDVRFVKANYLATTLHLRIYGAESPRTDSAELVMRLVKLTVIWGQVFDDRGHPLSGARITAMLKEGASFRKSQYKTIVDQRGEYRLHGLPPGHYTVAALYNSTSGEGGSGMAFCPANHTSTLAVGPDAGTVRCDFIIPSQPPHKIAGRVITKEGNNQRFIASLVVAEFTDLVVATTYTDGGGSYSFDGLASGSYFVFLSGPVALAMPERAMLAEEAMYGRVRVDVADHDVTGLTTAVYPGTTVAFSLVSVGTGTPCSEAVQVDLALAEGWAILGGHRVLLSSKNRQIVQGLAPARYRMLLSAGAPLCSFQPIRYGSTTSELDGLDLSDTASGEAVGLLVAISRSELSNYVPVSPSPESCLVMMLPYKANTDMQVFLIRPGEGGDADFLSSGRYGVRVLQLSYSRHSQWWVGLKGLRDVVIPGDYERRTAPFECEQKPTVQGGPQR
jgi:hypothetical protein